jgi:hypothetical protein
MGHALDSWLYKFRDIRSEGVNGQIPEIYIWNALIELAGFCNCCPLDKIFPEREEGVARASRPRRNPTHRKMRDEWSARPQAN